MDEELDLKRKRFRTMQAVLKTALLLGIVVGIPVYFSLAVPGAAGILRSQEAMNAFLESHRDMGILVYCVLQLLQVLTGVLPGQIVQFAGGYLFGVPLAYALSIATVSLGTWITFHLSRHLGRDLVVLLFKEKRLASFVELMNSKSAFLAIIVVYLIPGLPKDIFPYAAGLSHMRSLRFVTVSSVARSPAMLCSLLFGSFLRVGNLTGVIVIVILVAGLLLLAVFKRKSIGRFLSNLHESNLEAQEPPGSSTELEILEEGGVDGNGLQ